MAIVTIDTALALILNGLLNGIGIFLAVYLLGKLLIKKLPEFIHLIMTEAQKDRVLSRATINKR